METRTIAIANTKTQKRYTIESNAETLGELQDQMASQGIDFAGMSFTEGISKTQLLDRNSPLPTNVMYKGQPTNNLVMLLTNTTKNIASGALSRKEVYALIKDAGVAEDIKEDFGDNYTRISTVELENWLDEKGYLEEEDEDDDCEFQENYDEDKDKSFTPAAPHDTLVEWLYDGIKTMANTHQLYVSDLDVLIDLLTDLRNITKEKQVISDEDIDDIIASI